jgi:hypothetical protein
VKTYRMARRLVVNDIAGDEPRLIQHQFYNDIAERVTKFQRECQDWALQTRLAAV